MVKHYEIPTNTLRYIGRGEYDWFYSGAGSAGTSYSGGTGGSGMYYAWQNHKNIVYSKSNSNFRIVISKC